MNFLDKTGVTELVRKIKEFINNSNFITYTETEEWEE